MKKEGRFWAATSLFLGIALLVLVVDDYRERTTLSAVQAELNSWKLYGTFTMNELRGLGYDQESKAPERQLPSVPWERLLALAERVEGRIDHLEITNAKLKLGLAPESHAEPHGY